MPELHDNTPKAEENELITQRKIKLKKLREQGNPYINSFRRSAFIEDIIKQFGGKTNEELTTSKISAKLAGRIMLKRVMGKASFIQLQDMTGRIQIYIRQNDLPEGVYSTFKDWDLGDIVGVEGFIFKTKTGELSIHAEQLFLLVKSLRPLPDKYHGLSDRETRYRKRYVDLIANEDARKTFLIRSQVIDYIRRYLHARRFIEVETPMMQVIPGGAAARPFITHHQALNMPLYLRIAPELYLKRLVVGGFERVFEINRNFRNEGVSTQHNPEFTMLEFYQAYADYQDLMHLTEDMLRSLVHELFNTTLIHYQDMHFDFSKPFSRITLHDAILQYDPDIQASNLAHLDQARQIAERLKLAVSPQDGLGKIQTLIFEQVVEQHLKQPTFITAYPTEVSPLARRNDENPFVTDRFEFFMAGKEIGNGFSELNDPDDQAERFKAQVNALKAGDAEAMHYDADYIESLEYGLPPTAGEGIGIDRLVMMLTDSPSIRDVILFPHLRDVSEF